MGTISFGCHQRNSHCFGDYDQCVDIDQSNDSESIVGKYCLLNIHIPIPTPMDIAFNDTIYANSWLKFPTRNDPDHGLITNGVCLPSECEKSEIKFIFQKSKYINNKIHVNVDLEINKINFL